jgi:hypothetical protein
MVEEQITITMSFPKSILEQIGASADRDNHTVEDEIRSLVGLALAIDGDVEELAEQAEHDYAAHLAATGRTRPTTDEMWEQMRRVREEVADELYPATCGRSQSACFGEPALPGTDSRSAVPCLELRESNLGTGRASRVALKTPKKYIFKQA